MNEGINEKIKEIGNMFGIEEIPDNIGDIVGMFLENKENVLFELDLFIESLQAYRDAISRENMPDLIALLEEGKRRKEEVDG